MVILAAPSETDDLLDDPLDVTESFWGLFPHRFDYIYAQHPEPGASPHWHTETRYPLSDRLLHQSSYLYGVRFGKQTQYAMLDIDRGSLYHPERDPLALQRITAALEAIGLTNYLACTSSYSGGLHLYFPFPLAQKSWELGTVVTVLLENAGLAVKPGLLEVFPNRRVHNVQGTPSLFNAHRLPLQSGSYLLNPDLEPIWSNYHCFLSQWQQVQKQNDIASRSLKRILKQSQRRTYQISGRATKFLNDLNAEIELGWTGHGQTNYLLGRIAMRTYVFHHVLEDEKPLEGQALTEKIVDIAQSLPGYKTWCRHQLDIQHRASEWARCVENSRYFHYGETQNQASKDSSSEADHKKDCSWNQQQSNQARTRIQQAIVQLLENHRLPVQTGARFKALTQLGIGGGSLYRHKDLWHPEFLVSDVIPDVIPLTVDSANSFPSPSPPSKESPNNAPYKDTNLFPLLGGNALLGEGSSHVNLAVVSETGGNALSDLPLCHLLAHPATELNFATELTDEMVHKQTSGHRFGLGWHRLWLELLCSEILFALHMDESDSISVLQVTQQRIKEHVPSNHSPP